MVYSVIAHKIHFNTCNQLDTVCSVQNLQYYKCHCHIPEATGDHTHNSFQEDIRHIPLLQLNHCKCHLDRRLVMIIYFLDSKILLDNHCRIWYHQESIHQLSKVQEWCFYFDNCKIVFQLFSYLYLCIHQRNTVYFLRHQRET